MGTGHSIPLHQSPDDRVQARFWPSFNAESLSNDDMADAQRIEADIRESPAKLKNLEKEGRTFNLHLESPVRYRDLLNELEYPYTKVAEKQNPEDVLIRLVLLNR